MYCEAEKQNEPIAIAVEQVGKCYQIYNQPKDRLLQMLFRHRRQYFREFWALRDLSFQIRKGETVGIIGRNGSGKSTLLQMICGTLNPTTGNIRTQGRIAALLELGAGFNPEFTGRENVYMAASLYGLGTEEVDRRFADIEKFADIGEHIEQPVKNYSSGMYVRLAFAVIAHVDADILVIDEALAVGDAVFTQKCMRFIRAFRERGTLLFVSHDINSVLTLCETAIWLHKGELRGIGKAKDIAENYLQYTLQEVYGQDAQLDSLRAADTPPPPPPAAQQANTLDYSSTVTVIDNLSEANGWKTGAGEITGMDLLRHDGADNTQPFMGGENITLKIHAVAHQAMARPILGFMIKDRLGQDLFGENTLPFTDLNPLPVEAGQRFAAAYSFTLPMLPNGQYVLTASLADGDLYNHVQHHWLHDALVISVSSSKVRWGLVGIPFHQVSLETLP